MACNRSRAGASRIFCTIRTLCISIGISVPLDSRTLMGQIFLTGFEILLPDYSWYYLGNMTQFARFYARLAIAHFASYVVIGAISYMLIMRYFLPLVPADAG